MIWRQVHLPGQNNWNSEAVREERTSASQGGVLSYIPTSIKWDSCLGGFEWFNTILSVTAQVPTRPTEARIHALRKSCLEAPNRGMPGRKGKNSSKDWYFWKISSLYLDTWGTPEHKFYSEHVPSKGGWVSMFLSQSILGCRNSGGRIYKHPST